MRSKMERVHLVGDALPRTVGRAVCVGGGAWSDFVLGTALPAGTCGTCLHDYFLARGVHACIVAGADLLGLPLTNE